MRKYFSVLVSAAVLFVSVCGTAVSAEPNGSVWKGGYWAVCLPADRLSAAESVVRSLGFDEVFTIYDISVQYTDWHSLVEIPLVDMPQALLADDPRYDAYLKQLPMYFRCRHGGIDYEKIYFKTDIPLKKLKKILDRGLSGITWHFTAERDYPDFQRLPDAAMLENHYRYQLGLPYGNKEYVSFYHLDKNKVTEENIPLTQFTFSLFKDIMVKIGKSGVTGLILSQTDSN